MQWVSPYQVPTGNCVGHAMPGAQALLAYALEEYGSRGLHSGGIYNCRTVRGATSPSCHCEGRAPDLMIPFIVGQASPMGNEIVSRFGAVGSALGITCVIYARRIYSAKSPNGRRYDGLVPHWDHLHTELSREAAQTLTLARCRALLGSSMAPSYVGAAVRSVAGLAVDGDFGPATVMALQRALIRSGGNCRVDGKLGPQTVTALQLRLNHLRPPVTADGKLGPRTISVLQALIGARADGKLGPATVRALQVALNHGASL